MSDEGDTVLAGGGAQEGDHLGDRALGKQQVARCHTPAILDRAGDDLGGLHRAHERAGDDERKPHAPAVERAAQPAGVGAALDGQGARFVSRGVVARLRVPDERDAHGAASSARRATDPDSGWPPGVTRPGGRRGRRRRRHSESLGAWRRIPEVGGGGAAAGPGGVVDGAASAATGVDRRVDAVPLERRQVVIALGDRRQQALPHRVVVLLEPPNLGRSRCRGESTREARANALRNSACRDRHPGGAVLPDLHLLEIPLGRQAEQRLRYLGLAGPDGK